MEDQLLVPILIYFVVIPLVNLVVWHESNPSWLSEKQTFFQYIISKNNNLTTFGNLLLILLKLGAIPTITILELLSILFIKQGDK